VIRVQKYDQCGELISGADVKDDTIDGRDAYLGIDSKDNVVLFHSHMNKESGELNPCQVVKLDGEDLTKTTWQDRMDMIDGQHSCVPTGVKVDCMDNIYISGYFASNRGFLRKYDREGNILWTKADFVDQVTEIIYDPRQDVLVVTVGSDSLLMVSARGQEVTSLDIRAREIALSDDGYFVFHWIDGHHKIGYLAEDLTMVRNYEISWSNWDSIARCDNLVPNVYGTEVYLTCFFNDARDVIIFQTKLGDEKTYLGARAEIEE